MSSATIELNPTVSFFLFQAEILENVYTDCTRLDEALKRGEALHAKEADSSEAVHSQPSEYSEYSSAEIQLNYKVFQSTDSKHSSLTLLAKNTIRTYEEHMKKLTSLLHLVE